MNQRILLLIMVVLVSVCVMGQGHGPEEGGGGIVYGAGIGAIVQAPSGWLFDSQSAVQQGLDAVLYPVGSTWANATEIIYVNFSSLDEGQSLEAFIADEIKDFKTHSPDLVVTPAPAVEMKNGKSAVMNLLSGDTFGNHEAIAYAAHDAGVAMFVVSCRNEASLQRCLPTFKGIVSSSVLVTMKFEKE